MVDSILVQRLQLLEDVRRLRLPLLGCDIDVRSGISDFGGRFPSLDLISPFLGGFEILGDGCQVALDRSHCSHLFVFILVLPQRFLNVRLDVLRKGAVGLRQRLGGADNAFQWRSEYAISNQRRSTMLRQRAAAYPTSIDTSCRRLPASFLKPCA